jgi:hypothetical protein
MEGELPQLSGSACTTFLAEESWFRGKCQHRCNAFYLQVDSKKWHRFRVHCVGTSWKPVPSPVHPGMEDWEFRLAPLEKYPIVGRTIERMEGWEDLTDQWLTEELRVCREAKLTIHFTDNSQMLFHYYGGNLVLELTETPVETV